MLQGIGARSPAYIISFWSRAHQRVESLRSRGLHVQSSEACRAPTPVEKIICDSIRASGPITVSNYIQLCLSHPTEGYYMKPRPNNGDVFGIKGDFTTSPEISQIFGELVCLWFLSIWRTPETALSYPKIRIVELGPGRGTLMDDILRTLSMWNNSRAAISNIHLVENSPAMRSRQAQKLAPWRGAQNIPLHWWDSIEDIPDASDDEFTMVIAHEFFDALPKTPNGFREVLIDLKSSQDNPSRKMSTAPGANTVQFCFVLAQAPTARSDMLSTLSPRFANLPSGSRVEVSGAGWRIARKIGEMVSGSRKEVVEHTSPKGAALIMDYGDEHTFGTSFRAFRAHRHVDVFDQPGMSDLTTNVDFALLKEAIKGTATVHGTLDQASFLLRMGVHQRLAALVSKTQSKNRRTELGHAVQRLVDPSGQGMGKVYRVLGITGSTTRQETEIWPFLSPATSETNK